MGKKSSDMPPAPNPASTIAAQSAANKDAIQESARVNSVNVYGPFGSTTYDRDASGIPTAQRTTLSPTSQRIYDTQQGVSQNLWDTASNRVSQLDQTPYTTSRLPYNPAGYNVASMPTWSATSVGRNGGVYDFSPSGQMQYNATPPPARGGYLPGNQPQVRTPQSGQGQQIPYPHSSGNSMANPPPQAAPTGAPQQPTMQQRAGQFLGGFGVPSEMLPEQFRMPTSTPQPTQGQAGYTHADYGGGGGSGGYRSSQPDYSNLPRGPNPQSGDVIPYDPRSYGNMDYFSSSVGDAIYNKGMSRLDPQMTRDNREFEQTMANRGIPIGSKAYNDAKQQLDFKHNDAMDQLANSSTMSSLDASKGIVGLEQGLRGTAWGESLASVGQQQNDWNKQLAVQQQLRQTLNAEQLQERNQGINEVSAILQGSPAMGSPQAPTMPNYNVAPVDVAGITGQAYNAAMQGYQANQSRQNSNWQGAMGIGAAAMPYLMAMSNSSFKDDLGPA